jgi:hypothetical protein
MKRMTAIFLSLFVVLSGIFLYVRASNTPPEEKKLIESFHAHRPDYERLRLMFQEDERLVRVSSSGVETIESPVMHTPPEGGFRTSRYNEYLGLLRQTGGLSAFRRRGDDLGFGIGMWASGWAGNTRHVAVCWLDKEPANQMLSLDNYYLTPKPRSPVFRHIEGNWYLWADW